jgi:predicted transcriptional regulator of viral defense system
MFISCIYRASLGVILVDHAPNFDADYLGTTIMNTLTPTGRLALLALRERNQMMTIAQLADATGATPSSMIRIAGRLCKAGFITRHRIGAITHYTLSTAAPGTAITAASTPSAA